MLKSIYYFLNPRFQNLFLEYKVNFRPRYRAGGKAHKALEKVIAANRRLYSEFLGQLHKYEKNLLQIKRAGEDKDNQSIHWNNGYLPGLDIVALYIMLAELRPDKYIEIGSGNSTRLAHKAITEQGLPTKIISIDPQPRAEIDTLAHTVIREPFENINFDIIGELNENDVLFVDNSHRILPNSDAMVFFLEILPALKKGVMVHLHDIYLPFDYPQDMCYRFYSEQYGLAMYLLADPEKYQVYFPAYYVSEDKELSALTNEFFEHDNLQGVERHGGSFWIKINK